MKPKNKSVPVLVGICALSLLPLPPAQAVGNDVDVRAFVNDSCIIADEPYLAPPSVAGDDQATARAFPLLGLVVGKLAEMMINHLVKSSSDRIRSGGERKDTRYAMTREMNLYRADFEPAPSITLNAKLGCMTIVAASFAPEGANCAASYVPRTLSADSVGRPQSEWKSSRSDDSIENQLRRANICVAGKARAVYEARFEFSEDGTAYRLHNAGYHVQSLLTSDNKGEPRTTYYTLEISQPSTTDKREVLSTAWVNLGTVSAGSSAREPAKGEAGKDAPPWLHVPSLSADARRAYEEQTSVQHEVMGEIEALQRASSHDQRVLAGLDQRIADATAAGNADVAEGLKQERTKVSVRIQTQQAELEARRAEYQDLPRKPLEFMPVTIEVGVTESRSEKKALLELADIVNSNGGQLASAGASVSAGLFSRSLDAAGGGAPADPAGELERARANYFDAVVAAKGDAAASSDAQQQLRVAKARYNEARRALGLGTIQ